MNEFTISSVDEFAERVRCTYDQLPVFRGQEDALWELRPKFGRLSAANSTNDADTERETLSDFKRRAPPYLERNPANDWEWLALAQHHGLATRLLDWSTNPLIAAYFAIRPRYKRNAAIYVLDSRGMASADMQSSPFEIQQDCIFHPPHVARRIESQAGLFTAHADPAVLYAPPTLQKWTIDNQVLPDLWVMLQIYGVRSSLVFPGLESICQDIHQQWIR